MTHTTVTDPCATTAQIIEQLDEVAETAWNIADALSKHEPLEIPEGALATSIFNVARHAADYRLMLGGE